jgi:hypothetical protein
MCAPRALIFHLADCSKRRAVALMDIWGAGGIQRPRADAVELIYVCALQNSTAVKAKKPHMLTVVFY